MKFNWFHFGIGFFFLGLQFTHMDVGPLQRFTLVPSVMKTWGWFLWSFFIVNVILVVKIPQAAAELFGLGWGWGSYAGEPYEDSIHGALVDEYLIHCL